MNPLDTDALLDRIKRLGAHSGTPMTRAMRRRALREGGLLVGYENRRPVYVPFRKLFAHMILIGRSGRGKSMLLYAIAAQLILAGYTVVVLDGKGDLVTGLTQLCAAVGKSVDQVAIIDPHESSLAVGINAIERFGTTTPEHIGRSFIEGIKKIYKETQTKFFLEEWGPGAIALLSAAGLTAAEWEPFAQVGDEAAFRHAVIAAAQGKLATNFNARKWLHELASHPHQDQAAITNILRTRGSLLWNSPALLPVLGQQRTSIDWQRGLNTPGNVVLCDLGLSESFTDDESRMLGIAILRQITAVAWERKRIPEAARNRVFVIIDEAARYCDRELARNFEVMRGLGVSFILSNQTLEQLREEDEYVAASILGNANVIASFATSRADSELLARELFTGHLDFRRIKDELYRTMFRPVESTREIVTDSESSSSSHGEGRSDGEGASGNTGLGVLYTGDEPGMNAVGSSESSGAGWSKSACASSSESTSSSSGRSTTHVPFYELHEMQELAGRSFVPIEELFEEAIGAIHAQPVQHAVIAVESERPVSIVTPTIAPVRVPDRVVSAFRQACLTRFSRNRAEVLQEIEERVPKFIAAHRPSVNVTFNEDEFLDPPPAASTALPTREKKP